MNTIDNIDVVLLFFAFIVGAIGIALMKESLRHVYKHRQRIGPLILSLILIYFSFQLVAWSNLIPFVGSLI